MEVGQDLSAINPMSQMFGAMVASGGTLPAPADDPVAEGEHRVEAGEEANLVGPLALSLTPVAKRRHRVTARRRPGGEVVGLDTVDLARAGQRERFIRQVLAKLDLPEPDVTPLRSSMIENRGLLPAAEVVDYMTQAALGLAHAHERGIVHRDVKPPSLLLSAEGQIKVLDLGPSALMEADSAASYATVAGRIVGTVNYMSPEQAIAHNVDGRSDLFSLGCTMYQLLSGRLPFPGETLAECITLRIKGHSTPITDFRPDLSPRLVQLLGKLMARRPDDRFRTAAEAAEALRTLADQEAGALPAPRPTPQPVPDLSVPQPAASPDLSSAVSPYAPPARDRPVPVALTWSEVVSFLAVQPPMIALFILLFELAVFVLGFALASLSRTAKSLNARVSDLQRATHSVYHNAKMPPRLEVL